MARRFIAGVVCPRCGELDKMVIDSEADVRECIACGFSEQRPTAAPAPLKTRVNRPAARRVETPAAPVRIVQDSPDADD